MGVNIKYPWTQGNYSSTPFQVGEWFQSSNLSQICSGISLQLYWYTKCHPRTVTGQNYSKSSNPRLHNQQNPPNQNPRPLRGPTCVRNTFRDNFDVPLHRHRVDRPPNGTSSSLSRFQLQPGDYLIVGWNPTKVKAILKVPFLSRERVNLMNLNWHHLSIHSFS